MSALYRVPALLAAVLLGAGCAVHKPLGEEDSTRIQALEAELARAEQLEARECAPKELAIAKALVDYERYSAGLPPEAPRAEFPPAALAVTDLLAKTEPCWLARHDVDGDKVADDLDQCPDTPGEAKVDAVGCPLDGDADGVADYLDRCADTPTEARVAEDGCPLDGDADGVADYLDRCADTPAEAKVDADGCPLDGDADGVADYLDRCADTPAGVMVAADGCPPDGDADGVADYRDRCADTPEAVRVGEDGCPLDTDADGVADYRDQCPDTPEGVSAGEDGCPMDADADGVFDERDECPDTPEGSVVGDDGCEVTQETVESEGSNAEPVAGDADDSPRTEETTVEGMSPATNAETPVQSGDSRQ